MSACAHTWDAERIKLVMDALCHSGFLRLRLRGVSMLPSLWPGDEVEITRCSAAGLKRGDVVLAFRDRRLFLHRVVEISERGAVVTRGDAMPAPDPEFPQSAIAGRVVRVIRGERTAVAPARLTLLRRAFGILCCYSGVARRLALRFHGPRILWQSMAESSSETYSLTAAI